MPKLDNWIGRHFIIGLSPGLTLSDADRDLLSALRPAGVIVYRANFDHGAPYEVWLRRFETLLETVFEAVGTDSILVGIDHEGGRVCRTPPPLTRFSYPSHWARSARAVGAVMGRELASLGVNLNFAPLLDIASNPDNPVIGERAFSSTPDAVSQWGIAFMQGQQEYGVLACGKHFPGHGDTVADSHFELPVQQTDLAQLRTRELVPFRAAVEAGLGAIMTSHILFPQLDPVRPATLSRRVIQGLLREELGFDGLVMTDDLNMHAMDQFMDAPEAAAECLASGTDMLMVCAHWNDNRRALAFAGAIDEARRSGGLQADLVEQSQERIARLLDCAPRNRPAPLDDMALAQNREAGVLFGGQTVEVT
jgi:beta-N-acetylhexosaminidase